jgi:3'-5' exoribonuclease
MVAELQPGDRVTGFYLARRKQLEPFRDRTRGEFLTVVLADRTGQVLARAGEGATELAELFTEGDVVKVAGEVEEYLGRTQLIIQKLRKVAESEFDLADFRQATQRNVEEMQAAVGAAIGRVQNPHLAALLRRYYDDPAFRQAFSQAPASRRLHHAYLGGLLEHTCEALALCDAVLAIYPNLDADLLLSGVLLRDIGKTVEYGWRIDLEITDAGRLLGHIVLGDEMISQAIAQMPDFPPELSLRLRHLVVSHHGRYEWGSPRRPATLEAITLHQIEELTAQVSRFEAVLGGRREPGEAWTSYDRLLGRQLYAGRQDDSDSAPGEEGDLE